ncbi:MAG: DUF459 domain-containing protein [Kiritimatiellae bacterium]|nr:DUF459 domain-containing protein [Kiritimatiellia bacterium]
MNAHAFVRSGSSFLCAWALSAAAAFAQDEAPRSPVLLVGDSMMRMPGTAMERQLKRIPDIQAFVYSGIGTGLARLDAFDWMAKLDALCAEHKPKVAVVALGANDRQPMKLPHGTEIVQPGTPEWDAEYARRIGTAMDHLIAGGCERVIWLLLPPMREPQVSEFAKHVNTLIVSEAERRPKVIAHDFSPLVVDRRTGGFTERVMDPKTAAAIRIRETDGIHLSADGSRLLATSLIETYWK